MAPAIRVEESAWGFFSRRDFYRVFVYDGDGNRYVLRDRRRWSYLDKYSAEVLAARAAHAWDEMDHVEWKRAFRVPVTTRLEAGGS